MSGYKLSAITHLKLTAIYLLFFSIILILTLNYIGPSSYVSQCNTSNWPQNLFPLSVKQFVVFRFEFGSAG